MVERNGGPQNWRAEIFLAAIRQGPSFVVLLLLLWGGWEMCNYVVIEGIPAHLEQIKAGYRDVQRNHHEDLQRVVDAFETEAMRYEKVIAVIEPALRDKGAVRENHELLLQVVRELKRLGADRPARGGS